MSKSLALITARGGSKRIPRKNIRLFLGKPIISYSIKAACESEMFDEVMVSTDDQEIAEIAKKCGAKVPFMRSEKNSNDFAITADVIREVLECYKERGVQYDRFCCIYPTAPFVTAKRLVQAMKWLDDPSVEAVVPVTKFSFPIQRAMQIKDDFVTMVEPQYTKSRSQDLPPRYHDCGQFYCGKVVDFMKSHSITPARTRPLITSELEMQDIDSEEDWKLAELKFQLINA